MKNLAIIAVLTLVPFFISGCGSEEDSGITIESRIAALETAINTHSYADYRACFAESSSMQYSYTQTQFDNKFGSAAPYTTYDFGAVTVNGTVATCTSTKSTSGSTPYDNEFTMVKEGESWFIGKWDEDTTPIWFVPVRK